MMLQKDYAQLVEFVEQGSHIGHKEDRWKRNGKTLPFFRDVLDFPQGSLPADFLATRGKTWCDDGRNVIDKNFEVFQTAA